MAKRPRVPLEQDLDFKRLEKIFRQWPEHQREGFTAAMYALDQLSQQSTEDLPEGERAMTEENTELNAAICELLEKYPPKVKGNFAKIAAALNGEGSVNPKTAAAWTVEALARYAKEHKLVDTSQTSPKPKKGAPTEPVDISQFTTRVEFAALSEAIEEHKAAISAELADVKQLVDHSQVTANMVDDITKSIAELRAMVDGYQDTASGEMAALKEVVVNYQDTTNVEIVALRDLVESSQLTASAAMADGNQQFTNEDLGAIKNLVALYQSGDIKKMVENSQQAGVEVTPGMPEFRPMLKGERKNTGIMVSDAVIKAARAKAATEKGRVGKSLSALVELLLWQYAGSPKELLQTATDPKAD